MFPGGTEAPAHLDYAILLPPKQALAQTLEATRLDPDNATALNNLATDYLDLGEYAQELAKKYDAISQPAAAVSTAASSR